MSNPSAFSPRFNETSQGIYITFESEMEIHEDDLEAVDLAFNYFKYIIKNTLALTALLDFLGNGLMIYYSQKRVGDLVAGKQ